MPYYRGDYYRGDYYRGDPGLFSFIGNLAKTAIGFVTNPVGTATQLASHIFAGSHAPPGVALAPATPALPPGLSLTNPGIVQTATGGLANINYAQQGAVMPGGAMQSPGMAMVPFGARRQHPNRSTYVTRGGGTSHWPQELELHPRGTTMVTSRRMNVGNARALRRALRRARGFAKLAHKVLAATRHFKGARGRTRARK